MTLLIHPSNAGSSTPAVNVEQGARLRTGDVSDEVDVDVVAGFEVVGGGSVISEVIVDVNTPTPPPGSGLVVLFSSALVVSEPSVVDSGVVLVVLVVAGEVVEGEGFTGKAAVAEIRSTYIDV